VVPPAPGAFRAGLRCHIPLVGHTVFFSAGCLDGVFVGRNEAAITALDLAEEAILFAVLAVHDEKSSAEAFAGNIIVLDDLVQRPLVQSQFLLRIRLERVDLNVRDAVLEEPLDPQRGVGQLVEQVGLNAANTSLGTRCALGSDGLNEEAVRQHFETLLERPRSI
jgi:hypothetical protein